MVYQYLNRPGYGSDYRLLEFVSGAEGTGFIADLLQAIKELNPKIKDVQDLWMNDEILWTVETDGGSFLLSKDIWGLAFIMTEEHQLVIAQIDELLRNHPKFETLPVDDARYKY